MKRSLALLLALLLAACTPPAKQRLAAAADAQISNDIAQARQLRQSGKAAEAAALLQGDLSRNPDNPELLGQLGYAQIASDRSEDAVRTFDQLIALDPDSASAYDGKAMAFDHAGNHLAAQELYQRALKLAPDSLQIKNNLAVSLILNGQITQAIGVLEKLNGESDNRTVRQNLALAYGLNGQDDKALTLNLKDLPPDQAKENIRFYESFRKRLSSQQPGTELPKQIGFAAGPAAIMDDTMKPALKQSMPEKPGKPKETTPAYMVPIAPDTISPADKAIPDISGRVSPQDSAMPLTPPPEPASPADGSDNSH